MQTLLKKQWRANGKLFHTKASQNHGNIEEINIAKTKEQPIIGPAWY